MGTSRSLWETLTDGIKTASAEIGMLFKPKELTLALNDKVMTPVTRQAAETVKNTVGGAASVLGLDMLLIWVLVGAVAALFLMRKLKI